MPPAILLICIPVGLILGQLLPAKILIALAVFIGVVFLIVVGAHVHVFPGS